MFQAEKFHKNFITHFFHCEGMILDDARLASEDWIKVPGSEFSYLRKEITSGIHFAHHESPIVGFGLYVYGFAYYDSYGYPGWWQLISSPRRILKSIV